MGYDVYHYVEGVKPADEKFKAMKNVVENLRKLHMDIPDEIVEYFGVDDESEIDITSTGIILDITKEKFIDYKKERNGDYEIFEIDLASIPKDFTKIRFKVYHSY